MSAGGFAGDHQARQIEIHILGVNADPAKGAEAILDGCGSKRNSRHAVFHIDHIPSHFEPRQDGHGGGFLGAENPAAAVEEDHGGLRTLGVATLIKVQLGFVIVEGPVDDVGADGVFIRAVYGPGGGRRELREPHGRGSKG